MILRNLFVVVAVCSFMALATPVGAVTLYLAGPDMYTNEVPNGSESNPNGQWSYGTAGSNGGAVTLFPAGDHKDNFVGNTAFHGYDVGSPNFVAVVDVNVSGAPNSPCCGLDPVAPQSLFVHPGPVGDSREYAVVRWTAPGNGTIDYSATWLSIDVGRVQLDIYRNASNLYSNNYGGGPRGTVNSDSGTGLAVLAGDTFDFSIGAGGVFGSNSQQFDATISFTQTIPAPEPGSLAMLFLGSVGLLQFRRRK